MSFHYQYDGEDYQRLQRTNAYLKDFEATLDAASNIVELAETLHTNTSIESVRANIHNSFAGTRSPSEVLVLFEALGSRPNLKHIFLGTVHHPQHASLHVQPLSLSLIQAPRLTHLEVCGLELTGSSSDFTTLAASLHKHPSLQEIKIHNCRLPEEQQREPLLDALIRALGSISTLQNVVLNASVRNELGTFTAESLAILCGSGSLQSIGLLGFSLDEGQVVALATALVNNHTLKELCLGRVLLTAAGDVALAGLLRSGASALDYLDLQFDASSLSSPVEIAAALPHCPRLRHLFVHGALTPDSQRAFAQAIPLAPKMESLELMDGSPHMPAIRFHLKMNEILTRANLLLSSSSPSPRWTEVLISMRCHGVSGIFYLLSQNPLLFFGATTARTSTK